LGVLLALLAPLALTALLAPRELSAQGWVEPPPHDERHDVIRLETLVDVRVVGRVAHVEVTESFRNRGHRVAEGDYLFPLPGEAAFSGFSLFQGDLELRGEVLDADEARRVYEAIVQRRKDPALIELAGTGLLRARVFPIEPGDTRKVTLRFTQVLGRAGDALQFRYAPATGGAREIGPPEPRPFHGLATPERGRASEDAPNGPLFRLALVADEGERFLDPFSPTHALRHRRQRGRLLVDLEGEARGQLSLFLPLAGRGLGLSLATHRPPGEDGWFMLTLTPPAGGEVAEPRDLTVVLDVSGSMSGEKMEQARSAVLGLLETLSPRDRFRLIAFSSRVRAESEGWRPAGPADLSEASAWVEALQADGGTDIGGALDEALAAESPAGRLPLVVFLTDGLPTVGERDGRRIADRVESARGRTRIFAFGVGYDVDTRLLDELSAAARGTTTYVEPGENVARALELLAARVRHPVLTDLALERTSLGLGEIYPVTLPDVFAGEELVLFGRYTGEAEAAPLRVSGRRGGETVSFGLEASFPRRDDGDDYIPRLWASRKIGHLSRQVRLEGATPALVEEIRRTALRYGLPSEYTSYLVLEPEAVAMDAAATTGAPPPALARVGNAGSARAPTAPSAAGEGAVRAASAQGRMRDVRSEADLAKVERSAASDLLGGRADARTVGGRLFVLEDGVWTETGPVGAERPRVVPVKLFSRAWFDLVAALPELAAPSRELGSCELRGERVTLRLGDEGRDTLSSSEIETLVEDFRGARASGPAERRETSRERW
jgi:Ca-activated chloride channel family protein